MTMIGDFASTHLYDGQVGRGVGQELNVLDVLVLYLMVFVVMISYLIEILFSSLYFLKLFVIFILYHLFINSSLYSDSW